LTGFQTKNAVKYFLIVQFLLLAVHVVVLPAN
jgi:hypothetical protein